MKKEIFLCLCISGTYLSAETIDLDDVLIVDSKNTPTTKIGDFSSSHILNREKLNTITSKNNDISEVLKTNPNVIFNGKDSTSTEQGEINPQNFSINGAKFYQNSFLVDGVNFNNDIEPDGYIHVYKNIWKSPVLGSSAMNLNTDLLESIEVHDSSVSAKYGDFQGGVIKAKTRDPKKEFSGNLSFTYTSGKLSKSFIDSLIKDKYEDSIGWMDKSNFTKKHYRFGVEGYVSENFGLLFDYTNLNSTITSNQKKSAINTDISPMPNEKRVSQNYFLKAIYTPTDFITLKPSFLYALQENESFIEVVKDSNMKIKLGGYVANLDSSINLKNLLINQKISFSSYDSSRYFDEDIEYAYKLSNLKNWGAYRDTSYYGGLGDLEQKQKNFTYNGDFDIGRFNISNSNHDIKTGLEFSRQSATYKTKNPYTFFGSPKPLPDGFKCETNDRTCVHDDSFNNKGQYLSYKEIYEGVDNKYTLNKFALYLEDEIKINRFKFRPGIRVQKENLTDKINIAPRFVSEFDLLNDDTNFIGFGLNRYYGRNFFAYKIYSDMYSHYKEYNRTSPTDEWKEIGGWTNDKKDENFKTPYEDEFTLFYRGDIKNAKIGLKYIKRKSKNEIVAVSRVNDGDNFIQGLDRKYYFYKNDGKSDTDIVSLSVQNIKPIDIYGLENFFGLALTYMDKTTNFNSYKDSDIDRKVLYNGKVIEKTNLPAVEFYTPFSAKFNHIANIPYINLQVSNFINFNSHSYTLVRGWDKERKMTKYEKVKLPSYATWDMRFTYTKPIKNNMKFFINVDINNILNDKHALNAYGHQDTKYYEYATGRNVWLKAGFTW